MPARKTIRQTSILAWAALLGVVFVVFYTAITALGTKAAGKFSYVGPPPGQAAPPTKPTPPGEGPTDLSPPSTP